MTTVKKCDTLRCLNQGIRYSNSAPGTALWLCEECLSRNEEPREVQRASNIESLPNREHKQFIPVVVACIVEGDYVLLQGRENENKLRNHLELPGGKVEAEEELEQALTREMQEEIDCTPLDRPNLLHAQINIYPPDENAYLVLFYHVVPNKEPKAKQATLHWVSITDLHLYKLLPGAVESIQALVARR